MWASYSGTFAAICEIAVIKRALFFSYSNELIAQKGGETFDNRGCAIIKIEAAFWGKIA